MFKTGINMHALTPLKNLYCGFMGLRRAKLRDASITVINNDFIL